MEYIIRIHRPELAPEEREHRMDQIKKAAAQLVKAAYQETAGGKNHD